MSAWRLHWIVSGMAVGGAMTLAGTAPTQADEFMLVSDVFDPALRLRSLDIAAEAMGLSEPVVPAATIP